MRVQNTALGAIEISTSSNGPWTLVARTDLPALGDAPIDAESAPGNLRLTPSGAVLAFTKGRGVKIIPARSGPAPRDVLTVRPAEAYGRLSKLLRPGEAVLGLLHGGRVVSLHEGYVPSDGDWWMIEASAAVGSDRELASVIHSMGKEYRQHALDALRARGGKVTSGSLRVSAKLPHGTTGSTVTFLLDGVPVALLNRPPFQVLWDTRDWTDGEHMIEVRALDERGVLISRTKTLVVTANGG